MTCLSIGRSRLSMIDFTNLALLVQSTSLHIFVRLCARLSHDPLFHFFIFFPPKKYDTDNTSEVAHCPLAPRNSLERPRSCMILVYVILYGACNGKMENFVKLLPLMFFIFPILHYTSCNSPGFSRPSLARKTSNNSCACTSIRRATCNQTGNVISRAQVPSKFFFLTQNVKLLVARAAPTTGEPRHRNIQRCNPASTCILSCICIYIVETQKARIAASARLAWPDKTNAVQAR